MITVEFDCDFRKVAELCQLHIGPRKYYLHNKIGGDDWEVIPHHQFFGNGNNREFCTQVKIKDPKMATFLKLKLR